MVNKDLPNEDEPFLQNHQTLGLEACDENVTTTANEDTHNEHSQSPSHPQQQKQESQVGEKEKTKTNLTETTTTKKQTTVITFGTFDVFHYGHLRIIERAAELGDRLVVGVSSDALNYRKKQLSPTVSEDHRMEIVRNLKYVDEVFLEESLELKRHYCQKYNADILVMGHDHEVWLSYEQGFRNLIILELFIVWMFNFITVANIERKFYMVTWLSSANIKYWIDYHPTPIFHISW